MTDEEIIKEVAEKVMGWTIRDSKRRYWYEPALLISKFNPIHRPEHWTLVLEMFPSWELCKNDDGEFICTIWKEIGNSDFVSSEWMHSKGMAICLAALEAVKGKEETDGVQ